MAQTNVFRLARLSDNQVVELFKNLSDETEAKSVTFHGPGNLTVDLNEVHTLNLTMGSHILLRAMLSAPPNYLSIQFGRGISTDSFENRQPSAYFDEVQISVNQGRAQPGLQSVNVLQQVANISVIIERYGTVVQPNGDVTNFDGATDVISAEVAKLAALAAELTIGADTARRDLESERLDLQKKFDVEQADLKDSYKAKEAQLVAEQQELETLRETLDDREHKHVRRQLRETITSDLNEEILDPKRPSRGNLLTFSTSIVSIIGVIGLGMLAYQSQNAIGSIALDTVRDPETGLVTSSTLSNSPQVYLLYLKLFATSAAAFGMLLYTITWLRRLAADATRHQQQLQRHVFDMNRASWTIETILELSEAGLTEVPDIWLQSVTNNLFVNDDEKKDDTSSLQALGALLNVTSEAELGPDGPKFKLNRRGARKAASDTAN